VVNIANAEQRTERTTVPWRLCVQLIAL